MSDNNNNAAEQVAEHNNFEAAEKFALLDIDLTFDERSDLLHSYETVIGARRALDRIISSLEQKVENKDTEDFFSIGYNNIIAARRLSFRIISLIEQKEENKGAEQKLEKIKKILRQVEKEMCDVCSDILSVLEKHLISHESTSDYRMYEMKGKFHSYLAEFVGSGTDRDDEANDALEAYKKASNAAMTDLPAIHPIRLRLALNFSSFCYEILNSPDLACQLSKAAYDEANLQVDTLAKVNYKNESTLVMKRLWDNITLWTSDSQLGYGSADEIQLQTYLNKVEVSEDDPGLIIEFIGKNVSNFVTTALGLSNHGNPPKFIDWMNFSERELMDGFRKCLAASAGGYCKTKYSLALMPNDIPQFGNVTGHLAIFVSDAWFQNILAHMRCPIIAHLAFLQTSNIRSMEPFPFKLLVNLLIRS